MGQTELEYEAGSSVEPEVRACVASLVSALGGPSAIDNGRYVLGDDALAVLKDIKRWLKLWDEKTGRLDVARTLAESNLVRRDLLEILAQWPETATESSFLSKISLLCIDLLTILTWPISTEGEQNQKIYRYKHIPSLQRAQAAYKQAILHHDIIRVLRTAIRVALPALAQPQKERSPMEDNIIKVVLYLFRNIAMIDEPADFVPDDYQSDISRSSTIDAFHYQDIFSLILTICSGMGEDFRTHDVEILETVFFLVKGIDVERLFMESDELVSASTSELKSLMSKERSMLASYKRNGPTRHNRFGTMMWMQQEDGPRRTAFGQRAIKSEQQALANLDKKKTWKRPSRPRKKQDDKETPVTQFDKTVPLTAKARSHLRSFISNFLDSSFNPLMLSIRKAIEREASTIQDEHKRQYFYLISWFLRAETARRKKQAQDRKARPISSGLSPEVESYSLVASVLNQETFVLLQRTMHTAEAEKHWLDLNASMKCFTQILLTVQDMIESPLDEDQEIAENILNRIFYEQSTHDSVVNLLRTYNNQGFGYLDACTQMAHVFCRLLENYAKQNVDLQVRSRRRARKKDNQDADAQALRKEDREMHAEDIATAERTSTERKFDFAKFAARFVNQQTINTFVAFLRFYKDFNLDHLKRAHRFFYRAAFKMELTVYLFRMDIIALFNKLIKGPDGLDADAPMFKEWSELVRQVFRRLAKKMEERPALTVELLFSKIPSTTYYLEHGHDREIPIRAKRAPAELEIKPGIELEEQIGVVVSIMVNQGKFDMVSWIKSVLSKAAEERQSWLDLHVAQTSTESALTPDLEAARLTGDYTPEAPDAPRCPAVLISAEKPEQKKAMQDDKHVRLLLTTLSFQTLGDDMPDAPASWIIPSSLTVEKLKSYADLIAKFEFSPPVYDDDKSAEDFVRRKTAPRTRATKDASGSDSEGASDLDGLFPANLPDRRRDSAEPVDSSKPSRKRNRHKKDELLDDSVLDARREARRKNDADKSRKIKSALYVHASDDETDEEADRLFFEMEAQRRERNNFGVKTGGTGILARLAEKAKDKRNGGGKKKRKSTMPLNDDEAADDDDRLEGSDSHSGSEARVTKKRKSIRRPIVLDEERNDNAQREQTSHDWSSQASSPAPAPTRATQRQRPTAPFDDDDSEEDMPAMLSDSEAETDTPPSSTEGRGRKGKSAADADVDVGMTDADADAGGRSSDKENQEAKAGVANGDAHGSVLKDAPPSQSRASRGRAGFVLDDSDDE